MRSITSEQGLAIFQKMFTQLIESRATLIVWQISPLNGRRMINDSEIHTLNLDSGQIQLELKTREALHGDLPLYAYAAEGSFIFKTNILKVSEHQCTLSLPQEIKLLEEEDVTQLGNSIGRDLSNYWVGRTHFSSDLGHDVMRVKSMAQRSARDQELLNQEFGLSVDEEDRLFADKRESPRARPKNEKLVKVMGEAGDGPFVFKLFDLSRGGMGFVVQDEAQFMKGSLVNIVGFNDFDLDDPLVGKVMSIRPMDENQAEFKVGVKFSEGQD